MLPRPRPDVNPARADQTVHAADPTAHAAVIAAPPRPSAKGERGEGGNAAEREEKIVTSY